MLAEACGLGVPLISAAHFPASLNFSWLWGRPCVRVQLHNHGNAKAINTIAATLSLNDHKDAGCMATPPSLSPSSSHLAEVCSSEEPTSW